MFLNAGILQFFQNFVTLKDRPSSLCDSNLVLGLPWVRAIQDIKVDTVIYKLTTVVVLVSVSVAVLHS